MTKINKKKYVNEIHEDWIDILSIDIDDLSQKGFSKKSSRDWQIAAVDKLVSGYRTELPASKQFLKTVLRYCEDEIDKHTLEARVNKKYKNVYHPNTALAALAELHGFKKIKRNLNKHLKKK